MRIVKRRHPHPEIPLVSTADVAFLLLIFFLSTTIFAVQRGITLALPGPGERGARVERSRVAEVHVRPDAGLVLDGRAVPARELRAALLARLRGDPDLAVRITVDPTAPYAALVGALDEVKLAGARRISLQTETTP